MGHLAWTKNLETGIEVIDGQHKRIVDYINKLHDAHINGDKNAVADIIEATVDYTISHFSFEEALIEDAGYEFARPHKKVHELFIRKVSEFQDRFKKGEDITEELQNLLSRWLFNHIRNDDAAYVKAVKGNIVSITKDKNGWLANSFQKFFKSK